MATLSFFSNFLNHHQLPLCLELSRLLGEGFRFIATEPIHQERVAMGYVDMNTAYPFVIRSYESKRSHSEALTLGSTSDVVVIGSAPEEFVRDRLISNRLTFRYSERLFKKGRWRIVSPRAMKYLLWNNLRFANKQLYLLCASAYAAGDFAMVGAFRNKAYKWGYFPEARQHDPEVLMAGKKYTRPILLWVGRFLELKHPEKALLTACALKNSGVDFELNMIGSGPLETQLKELTQSLGLERCVRFHGFMSTEDVRKQMECASIFLFTSDYNEGWGAVLNEAMSSGCAVVASNAIGSVPFLVRDGENGFVYCNEIVEDLYGKVLPLTKDPELRSRLGNNAFHTIANQWNAKVAAERLIRLSEALLAGNNAQRIYNAGPCSLATPDY